MPEAVTMQELRARQVVLARIAGHPSLTDTEFLEVRDEWLRLQRIAVAAGRLAREGR